MAESGYTIVQLRRIAAVALALLCLMAPAWAEEAEISSMPAEARVEETQTFELGGDAWQDPAWTADVESRAEAGSQGPAYVPVSRQLILTTGKTLNVMISDTVDVTFSAGGFESFVSDNEGIAAIVRSDPGAGTAQVAVTGAGTGKLKAKLLNGKSLTLTLKAADPYLPTSVKFADSKVTLNVEGYEGGGTRVQLTPTVQPEIARTEYTWSSSNGKIATVSDSGLVTALSEGTARITVKTSNKKSASISIKVVDPCKPTAVSFETKTVTKNIGETWSLEPVLKPDTARTTYTWSSSNMKVADVSDDGVVEALKEGTARITVKTANKKSAVVSVKVVDPYKPVTVSIGSGTLELRERDRVTLKPTLTPDTARTTYTWISSSKRVADISDEGVLTAYRAGKTTITVKTANSKRATLKVVVKPYLNEEVTYRALLVAETQFYNRALNEAEDAAYNRYAADKIEKMLKAVCGAEGGKFSISLVENTTRAQLKQSIASAFAGADENDISLFYISSHGDKTSSGSTAGAVAMSNAPNTASESMKLSELRDCLLAVPGKVIILMDTCGSGAAVYAKGIGEAPQSEAEAYQAFDEAVVRVFAEADPGVIEVDEPASDGDVELQARTGEFRQVNKFYVLCSSRYQESSWAHSKGSMFTDWLVKGVGTSSTLPADAKYAGNNDGVLDLYELYSYISAVGDSYAVKPKKGEVYYQHVQVYPSNTRFGLFK